MGVVCVLASIWYADVVTDAASEGKVYTEAGEVPGRRVAVVFGCSPKIGERDNLYFRYRMEAASKLWESGNVRGFIVSGDNSRASYNEPEAMKAHLVAMGVPAEKVVCDYAGLRTWDSVVRAREVFGIEEVVFVSQGFQNARAMYMASELGIDAVSYSARDVEGRGGFRTKLRELLARPKMVLDIHVLGTEPKFLGEVEDVPFR
ncbi:vancomycin high temperature exclusion protein [Rubritalea tangerina]|uniref:Vancomycin high temperature exclusion protein n=2 Tax=Rubritalea tangerina TaxID=430798 RepID=A0ABW4ZCE5_9BACT